MSDWFTQNLSWMYWTLPSAAFFIVLFLTLVGMGIADGLSPSIARKGFLPVATTRGDRLFIVIMSAIGIHLLWLSIAGSAWLWGAVAISITCAILLFRWG